MMSVHSITPPGLMLKDKSIKKAVSGQTGLPFHGPLGKTWPINQVSLGVTILLVFYQLSISPDHDVLWWVQEHLEDSQVYQIWFALGKCMLVISSSHLLPFMPKNMFQNSCIAFPGSKLNLFNLDSSALLFLLLEMCKSFTCFQALQTSPGLLNLPSMTVLEGYEPVLLSPSWMQHELDNWFFLDP